MFEYARVDPSTPIEESLRTLVELRDKEKIGGITLDEVGVDTFRRLARNKKIVAVEIELSL